jgi:hypothetical protein
VPRVTLTVGLRAELLELLGMVRRSGSPLLALSVDRFQHAIERRSSAAPGPLQLALWEGAATPENRADQAAGAAECSGDASAIGSLGAQQAPPEFPEKFPTSGRVPSPEKTKGANP